MHLIKVFRFQKSHLVIKAICTFLLVQSSSPSYSTPVNPIQPNACLSSAISTGKTASDFKYDMRVKSNSWVDPRPEICKALLQALKSNGVKQKIDIRPGGLGTIDISWANKADSLKHLAQLDEQRSRENTQHEKSHVDLTKSLYIGNEFGESGNDVPIAELKNKLKRGKGLRKFQIASVGKDKIKKRIGEEISHLGGGTNTTYELLDALLRAVKSGQSEFAFSKNSQSITLNIPDLKSSGALILDIDGTLLDRGFNLDKNWQLRNVLKELLSLDIRIALVSAGHLDGQRKRILDPLMRADAKMSNIRLYGSSGAAFLAYRKSNEKWVASPGFIRGSFEKNVKEIIFRELRSLANEQNLFYSADQLQHLRGINLPHYLHQMYGMTAQKVTPFFESPWNITKIENSGSLNGFSQTKLSLPFANVSNQEIKIYPLPGVAPAERDKNHNDGLRVSTIEAALLALAQAQKHLRNDEISIAHHVFSTIGPWNYLYATLLRHRNGKHLIVWGPSLSEANTLAYDLAKTNGSASPFEIMSSGKLPILYFRKTRHESFKILTLLPSGQPIEIDSLLSIKHNDGSEQLGFTTMLKERGQPALFGFRYQDFLREINPGAAALPDLPLIGVWCPAMPDSSEHLKALHTQILEAIRQLGSLKSSSAEESRSLQSA